MGSSFEQRLLDAIDNIIAVEKNTFEREYGHGSMYESFDKKWKNDAKLFASLYVSARNAPTNKHAFIFVWDASYDKDYDINIATMENRQVPRVDWTKKRQLDHLASFMNIMGSKYEISSPSPNIFCIVADMSSVNVDDIYVLFLDAYQKEFAVLNYFIRLRLNNGKIGKAGLAICDTEMYEKLHQKDKMNNANITLLENKFFSKSQSYKIEKTDHKCIIMTWADCVTDKNL